jgi:hypothetical protein
MNDVRKYIDLLKNLTQLNESKLSKVGWNIQPEDWNFVASVVSIKDEDSKFLELANSVDSLYGEEEEKILFENYHDTCAICGHRIVNKVIFKNDENNIILTGFDCANNVMNYKFDISGAKTQGLRNRMQAVKLGKIQDYIVKNPGLDLWLTGNHFIINSIRENFYKFAKISDKQIELVKKLYGERTKYEETAKPFPIGKFTGDVVIKSFKLKGYEPVSYSQYNKPSSTQRFYITAEHKDGWKLYGAIEELRQDSYIHPVGYAGTVASRLFKLVNKEELFNFMESDDYKTLNNYEKHLRLEEFLKNILINKKINITTVFKENKKDPYMAFVNNIIMIN